MKLKNLILGLLASAAMLASCQPKEELLGAPALNLDPEVMKFDVKASSQTLNLTATRDWEIVNDADWLVFDPASGSASKETQQVTVTVVSNPETNRTSEVMFTIGLISKNLNVSQMGEKGEPELEITPIGEFIKAADKNKVCILKGTIVDLANRPGATYWGFDLSDGTGTVSAAFPSNWDEWKDKLKEGGTVVVKGTYSYYESKKSHQIKPSEILSFEEGQGGVNPPSSNAEHISCAEFIKRADTKTVYRLIGTLEGLATGSKFWGFDINDGTQKVTAAFPSNWDDWKSKLSEGGKVTVEGPYEYYSQKGTHQVKKCKIIAFDKDGGSTPDPGEPGETKKVSVKEFLASPVSDTQLYEITATIEIIADDEYGNIYVKDNTGLLYVYGLTKTPVSKNDKTFASLDLKETDIVTFIAKRGEYNNFDQAVNAYYVSHKAGEGKPARPNGPAVQPFTSSSNITWTVSEDAKTDSHPSYAEEVTIDGKSYDAIKLGTGSKYGKATLNIPAGTTKIGFYACAWKGTSSNIQFSNGTEVKYIRANKGATQSKPYKLVGLNESDYYEIEVKDITSLTIETSVLGTRALIFGVNPIK